MQTGIFESKRNDNVYHICKDKLVVKSGACEKEIPLLADSKTLMYYLEFEYLFYEGEKLFVVVATRDSYDARFEIDEDHMELKGPPISTY